MVSGNGQKVASALKSQVIENMRVVSLRWSAETRNKKDGKMKVDPTMLMKIKGRVTNWLVEKCHFFNQNGAQ